MIRKNLNINGKMQMMVVDPDSFLSDTLREQLKLTGTKVGCGQGQCGGCSVILDGKVVRSCSTKMSRVPDEAC
ncbi:MAG: 2Fe-2S iron-sulfur cluster-binding protein, partial [Deltaproteobacteria bacterium]|nr:2Fe-2S iron-sulfur cluster-binding protein [Deltaproteobacteria bacterium]